MMENREELWPGWKTVRVLGNGSFGCVYEIQRTVLENVEKAALKVISIPQNPNEIEELRDDGYDDESITLRFREQLKDIIREYSFMTKVKGHPNVVYCDDIRYVQDNDGMGWDIYIKMELLTPLNKFLTGAIPEREALRLARDLCAALELCRRERIVHRDIKPQNIFVSRDGIYKLGDFGIARTMEKTTGGTKTGIYNYMAPEVYNNEPYGSSADLYSLGLVLYWMLNKKRLPFLPLPPEMPTSSQEEDARKRRFSGESLPAPAYGSQELKQIVLKACAFAPKDRYTTPGVMKKKLERLLYGQRFETQEDATVYEDASIQNTLASLKQELVREQGEAVLYQEKREGETKLVRKGMKSQTPPDKNKTPQKDNLYLRRKLISWLIAAVVVCLLVLGVEMLLQRLTTGDPFPADDSQLASVQETKKSVLITETTKEYGETAVIREGTSGAYAYSLLSNGTVTITEYTGNATETKTPAEIEGHPVTAIGSTAFYLCNNLTSITIPNGVTTIGSNAFLNCYGLHSITIPDSVTTIGSGAFVGCDSLKDVYYSGSQAQWEQIQIVDGIEALGDIQVHCSGEPEITVVLRATSGDYAYTQFSDDTVTITDYKGNAAQLQIPTQLGGYPVTAIGENAFEGCYGLTEITIPDSVTAIGDSAFAMCADLTSVSIPDSVTTIGSGAFVGCDSLKDVYYSGSQAQWEQIQIVDGIEALGDIQVHCSGEPEITVVLRATSGDYAYTQFSDDTVTITDYKGNAAQLQIPTQLGGYPVTAIGENAFEGCYGLTEITIPDSVTAIGDSAFAMCADLTSVSIPDSVTTIGSYAFADCQSLTGSFVIPKNVTAIEEGTFFNCTRITNIFIPDSVTSIGDVAFFSCWGLHSITIPESVSSIGVSAFADCIGLTSITIPDRVTSIEPHTFSSCDNLTNITIPNSVTAISVDAFGGCSSLTNITIPDGVTYIGGYAFGYCQDLTSITIPNGVTEIDSWTFERCENLTSITIPDSVTAIKEDAFIGCDRLKNVYYTGSENQWNQIQIETRNDPLMNAQIHYNS